MKLRKLALSFMALLCVSSNVYGADITVRLNNKPVELAAPALIIDGRTLVPVRGVFDNMGYSITWRQEDRVAFLENEETKIIAMTDKLTVVDKELGKAVPVSQEIKPQIINDRFYIPLRAIAEATGAHVAWDGINKDVNITFVTSSDDIIRDESILNPKGSVSVAEDVYISMVFDKVNELKQAARDEDNQPLLRYFNLNYVRPDQTVKPHFSTYSAQRVILDELDGITAPKDMDEVDFYLKQFIALTKEVYNTAANTSLTEKELTEKIDELKSQRNEISSLFGSELYEYFCEHDVFYEKAYGEYVLDILQ